ncbi:DNA-directed RNA polymerase III complex large subunit Rpc1 [Saitoella complicata NRRL Y-17804]|uniref:DNA-directed RNA polymerase subunit n=1 Tax=Saitoella complicata (strain BCRC 22490 / CBS 7301 / JCM 7358 / NBRC 10748 / NRRL Y-17804) TaxID=698492 RepID=A0A0E9NDZ0_SAICN|nr:DNA-directed RNA polymerase III complex large subunit Rpc1 [Saitoella complicata NRRL Y-17804]ODQ54607.1 DNA-directed RNA polymerase III complex large subunit Rpc1 [Saitoella complicata NRRL Y-17804]GAO48072.1 hypothetical protein G7K_2259-t1 [Saitoella complicata NRRL Y-17804]
MKEQVIDNVPKRIKYLQFGISSPKDIVRQGSVEVSSNQLYVFDGAQKRAYQHGALDRRLGPSSKDGVCETCNKSMQECVGHFGHVKLALPCFHIGYFKSVITVLQNICKDCSRVLIDENSRRDYLKSLRRPGIDNLTRMNICKKINTQCKKVRKCLYCGSTQGVVKKAGPLKIIHEKYRHKKNTEEESDFRKTFEFVQKFQADIKPNLAKAHDDLNPLKVLNLFRQIKPSDCELLGMDPEEGRPEMFIWQYVPAPPSCIRPTVNQGDTTNEDGLTHKLAEIVMINSEIKGCLKAGQHVSQLMEQWEFLQLSIALYIHSEMPGVPPRVSAELKPMQGLCQRLKGKTGRFRGNLSGKRVDFSGRTVIGPDPNLRIDQVAVPERVAKILTYPERVTSMNIEKLKQCVINGTDIHPGANYIIDPETETKKYLKFGNRERLADELKIGHIVERHLNDDDIVLFNRQPSLHKLSILAHRAKIRPWRTFRLNECVCNPYNADFDGDEMNMHVPQTEEARTEAIELMGVKNNLVTPKNGEPIIAAIQDFITAAYLISRRDTFYDRKSFTHICSFMFDADKQVDLPPPTIWKPQRLWTGKQIFNVLMRANKSENVIVNLEAKCKTMVDVPKGSGLPNDMSPNDGYLVIRGSEVMCGVMDKATVGDGKKNSLFYVILRDYGPDQAGQAMNRLAKLCARWLANQGFSLGINDVQASDHLNGKKDAAIQRAYDKANGVYKQLEEGKLENMPGCTGEQTAELNVSGTLSAVRGEAGDYCLKELPRSNAPLIMAKSGSKGSLVNVAQMVALVGQQIIAGKRVKDGFQDRTLPHFTKGSKRNPLSKGFVRNSFYTGLTPYEFIFHAISGREGLVDTAVKTAETGYMSRRLMKSLEDLSAQYDGTVRNAVNGIVQFVYGDDGLDPTYLEGDGEPVEFKRTWKHCQNKVFLRSLGKHDLGERGLLPFEINQIVEEALQEPNFIRNCTDAFLNKVKEFVHKSIASELKKIREDKGLLPMLMPPEDVAEIETIDDAVPPVERMAVQQLLTVTKTQILVFLRLCWEKYMKAKVEPGTAVGAVGAQAIGEPGTQMTLKTFHFAGLASMNVTMGVPRIKEIINAAKTIAGPIITCELEKQSNRDEGFGREVKGRIEKTYLKDIAAFTEDTFAPSSNYISLKIDWLAVANLKLELAIEDISKAIAQAPKLKIGGACMVASGSVDRINIFVDDPTGKEDVYYKMQTWKRALNNIVVKGLPEVGRAILRKKEDKSDPKEEHGEFQLKIEGYGLREVMITPGVNGTRTQTNHIMETCKVLGIEAARNKIYEEIEFTMSSHGMNIDPRHMMLLSDVMTYKGEILGITRFGVAKMKDSVMMLASFEKTTDHLFDASFFHKRDAIEGVSECIIMGVPMPIGTGLFKLIRQNEMPEKLEPKRLLFDTPEHRVNMFRA